jgi:hypothetical protein
MNDGDRVDANAETVGNQLCEGGFMPWPWLCEPVRTSTVPTALTRTSADSQSPTPAPSDPTAADGAIPQASM